ncbi:steroid 21-hydroxylase-like isoform X2 [Rhinatrema bivittatum]|uniref:steroid 21-hydroxylase-like isoform X2 n=1 Tax=Rhinatrema bivittatum TaxID=194408 RepID=UPI00112924DD|nr:steroid 21-hydroxylase-like isoform X2 [Rhinatrema bivittatum]
MAGGCAFRCSPLLFRGFPEGVSVPVSTGQRRLPCLPEDGVRETGPSEALAPCAGCGGPICDRYFLFAIERVWHLSCLRCCVCRASLSSELTCFCKEGGIYCRDDYYRRFSVNRCARCHVGIPASEMVMRTPGGAVYHVACFSCVRCQAALRPGELFGVREGLVYCRRHCQQEEDEEEEEEEEEEEGEEEEEEGAGSSTQTVDGSALELLCARPPRRGRGRWRKGRAGPGNPTARDRESAAGGEASPEPRRQRRPRQPPPAPKAKAKRMRTCFKNHQLRTLESYFSVKQNPDGKDWERMARKTGLSKRVLQVWFQNARAKLRKTLSQEGSPETGGTPAETPEGAPASPRQELPARTSGTPEPLFPPLDLRVPYVSPGVPLLPLFLNFDLGDPLREGETPVSGHHRRMFCSSLLLLLLLLSLLALVARGRSKSPGPGSRGGGDLPSPRPLPVLGHLLELCRRDLPLRFMELSQRYGPVYRLRFGSQDVVVLNSVELIREALIKKWSDFAGRPQSYTGDLISFGGKDLSLGDYTSTWKIQRRLAHSSLQRSLRTNLEALISQEAQHLCQDFQSYRGTPMDVSEDFSLHTCRIIASLAFGVLFEKKDPKFQAIHKCITDVVQLWGSPFIMALDSFPLLRLPNAALDSLLRAVERRDSFVTRQLQSHKETFRPPEIRDITDSMIHFLRERRQQQREGEEEPPAAGGGDEFDEQHVHMAIVDLFIGGTETTASMLTWAVAFLLHHPRVQERIYSEMLEVLGPERLPAYSDRDRLPLLGATISEILRLRPVAPLAVPHATTRDTSLSGYFIPKGTVVIPNLYAANHDETKWTDPTHFRPERFLEAEDPKQAHRDVLAFSAGARVCLGESLARMEIFLFLTHLLHRFRFLPPTPGQLPDLGGIFGINLRSKPFQVRFVPRTEPGAGEGGAGACPGRCPDRTTPGRESRPVAEQQ